MYATIPKNTYSTKHRSDDLNYFVGGYIGKAVDLPTAVYLTKGNLDEKKLCIRLDLPSKYIEIPLSMKQLKEWFEKIEEEDAIALEEERESERQQEEYKLIEEDKLIEDVEQDKNSYIDIEKENLDLPTVSSLVASSSYEHEGDCIPSKFDCNICYRLWCSKCGAGVLNYMSGCCSEK